MFIYATAADVSFSAEMISSYCLWYFNSLTMSFKAFSRASKWPRTVKFSLDLASCSRPSIWFTSVAGLKLVLELKSKSLLWRETEVSTTGSPFDFMIGMSELAMERGYRVCPSPSFLMMCLYSPDEFIRESILVWWIGASPTIQVKVTITVQKS